MLKNAEMYISGEQIGAGLTRAKNSLTATNCATTDENGLFYWRIRVRSLYLY